MKELKDMTDQELLKLAEDIKKEKKRRGSRTKGNLRSWGRLLVAFGIMDPETRRYTEHGKEIENLLDGHLRKIDDAIFIIADLITGNYKITKGNKIMRNTSYLYFDDDSIYDTYKNIVNNLLCVIESYTKEDKNDGNE